MTDEQAQTPKDEQKQPRQITQEELDQMSYPEYLKLTHPGKSDEEIARMVRKEERNVWIVRFQLLAAILIAIVVLIFIFTK